MIHDVPIKHYDKTVEDTRNPKGRLAEFKNIRSLIAASAVFFVGR